MAWNVASLCLSIGAIPSLAIAQCPARWRPGDPLSGVTSPSVAGLAEWDEDGSGPLHPVVVAVGSFNFAGRTVARGVAAWNERDSEWKDIPGLFGPGTSPISLTSVSVMPEHDGRNSLVVTGTMALSQGGASIRVAKYSGSGWSAIDIIGQPLGSVTLSDGRVAIVGRIARSVPPVSNRVFILQGDTLTEAQGLPMVDTIRAFAATSSGELVIAGYNPNELDQILRWSGSSWSSIGSPLRTVNALFGAPDGSIYAAGSLPQGPSQPRRVVRWNGNAWQPVGPDFTSGFIGILAVQSDGQLTAVGSSTSATGAFRGAMRWDGIRWNDLGAIVDQPIRALLHRGNGGLIVGGSFTTITDMGVSGIARFQDDTWEGLTRGLNGNVTAAAIDASGFAVLGGRFTGYGRGLARSVVRWNGQAYAPMDSGLTGSIRVFHPTSTGALLAGGGFLIPGISNSANIARWSGTRWEALGTGLGLPSTLNTVNAIQELSDGSIVAGGIFNTTSSRPPSNPARWNGTAWQAMGTGVEGDIWAIKQLPDGRVVVGGSFLRAGGEFASNIAIWDGTTWQSVGEGLESVVFDIELTANGFVAVGGFRNVGDTPVNFVARWDGAMWHPLGNGFSNQVYTLERLPDGRLLAGGIPVGSTRTSLGISVWDGAMWSEFPADITGAIDGFATGPNGEVVAFGRALTFQGQTSYGAAIYSTRRICLGDFNCSDTLTTNDLVDYLNAWFMRSPTANVDGQPQIDTADLVAFINIWLSGC